ASSAYWPGWDIVRGLAYSPTGRGTYVLDGWGGVHAAGDAVWRGGPYWPGLDVARGITLTTTGNGYAVLDSWGGIHTFGDAPGPTGATWAPGSDWRAFAPTGSGYRAVNTRGELPPGGLAQPRRERRRGGIEGAGAGL